MRRATRVIIPTMLLIASTVGISDSASGESASLDPDEHCGTGVVQAITNAFYPLFWNSEGPVSDDVRRCQFRLFSEPAEGICFDELDQFVGGFVIFDLWANRVLLDQIEMDISVLNLGVPEPEPVETPIKALNHPTLGQTAWKQWSVTFEGLAPGSYTAVTTLSFAGSVVDVFEVEFHVLPHESAHPLGRPESGLEGSVVCPPEVLS